MEGARVLALVFYVGVQIDDGIRCSMFGMCGCAVLNVERVEVFEMRCEVEVLGCGVGMRYKIVLARSGSV